VFTAIHSSALLFQWNCQTHVYMLPLSCTSTDQQWHIWFIFHNTEPQQITLTSHSLIQCRQQEWCYQIKCPNLMWDFELVSMNECFLKSLSLLSWYITATVLCKWFFWSYLVVLLFSVEFNCTIISIHHIHCLSDKRCLGCCCFVMYNSTCASKIVGYHCLFLCS